MAINSTSNKELLVKENGGSKKEEEEVFRNYSIKAIRQEFRRIYEEIVHLAPNSYEVTEIPVF
jgi:hypothetical protein